jgi:porin
VEGRRPSCYQCAGMSDPGVSGVTLPLLALLAMQGPGPAVVQETDGQRARDEGDLRLRDRPSGQLEQEEQGGLARLLLDWGGARGRLEDAGFSVETLYTVDSSWAADGGADPGGTATRSLLDIVLGYDTEPALGLRGGRIEVGLQWIAGVDASARFGVAQAFSNIDAEHRVQVARVWYEQRFEGPGTRLRLGKIDANSLFARVDAGAGFLHSSMGFSPTILGLPTYPDPSFGGAVVQPLGRALELRAGILDGSGLHGVSTGTHGPAPLFDDPHDLFLIGEADVLWAPDTLGRLGLGAWRHTGEIARFDGGTQDGTQGLYAVLEQRLWTDAENAARGLDGFAQAGLADPDVSPFETHLGLGLVWNDVCALEDDHLGLGMSHVGLSGEPGAGFTRDDETAFELYFGFEPLPWMRLKPDIQYVVHPGGDAALDDALIATLRLTFSL